MCCIWCRSVASPATNCNDLSVADLNPEILGPFSRTVPAVSAGSVTVHVRQARQIRHLVRLQARKSGDDPGFCQLEFWAREAAVEAENTTLRRVTPETMYWAIAEVMWWKKYGGWPPQGVDGL